MELIRFAKESIENFVFAPIRESKSSIDDLTDGLELLFESYVALIDNCGKMILDHS